MLYFNDSKSIAEPHSFVGARKIGWILFGWMSKVITGIFPFLAEYKQTFKVTFGLTNFTGFVGHEKFANIFGSVREIFGLKRIPGFSKEVGLEYLLKTCDARYRHFDSFKFGDVIKTVVDVIEVNGASFVMRCRFMNTAGNVKVEATQRIAYVDVVNGKSQRFPFWLKLLLKFSERKTKAEKIKRNRDELSQGNLVFRQKLVVTSVMTNAERNVNHDEYVKEFSRMIELFFLKREIKGLVEVKEASYNYIQDFYFGDKMVFNLYVSEIGGDWIVFEVEFCDEAGKLHAHGRQIVYFTEESGRRMSLSLETRGALILPCILRC